MDMGMDMAIMVHSVMAHLAVVHSVAVPSVTVLLVEAPAVVVPSALDLMALKDTLNILLALGLMSTLDTLDTLSVVALSACIACLHDGPVEPTLQTRLTNLVLKSARITSSDDVPAKPLVKRLAKQPKLPKPDNNPRKLRSQSPCKPSL